VESHTALVEHMDGRLELVQWHTLPGHQASTQTRSSEMAV
jgi:hypothetical protein